MLNGWKAIAAYLGREERTAMRWATDRGLPVHRAPGRGRGSVYAHPDEIDAWMAQGRGKAPGAMVVLPAEPPVAGRWVAIDPWRRGIAGALIALGLALVIAGAVLRYPAPGGSAGQRGFTDPVAKAMYLQASYDWNLRTRESLTRAAQEYAGAIGRDPRVPASYVGLANTYLLLREDGSLPDADAYPRAEAAAQAALSLSPQSPEAHRALAFIAFWWRQDRAAARREFARAIAADPRDPLTHHWFATALLANGETTAALREIDEARELDPASTAIIADRGAILYCAGRRTEGLSVLHALAREQPDVVGAHRALAEFALLEGRAGEFVHEAIAAATLRHDDAGLATVARWSRAGPGAAEVEAAMLRDARQSGDPFRVAQVASLAGDLDMARRALGQACDRHEPAAISAASDTWLSRTLSAEEVRARCGRVSLMS